MRAKGSQREVAIRSKRRGRHLRRRAREAPRHAVVQHLAQERQRTIHGVRFPSLDLPPSPSETFSAAILARSRATFSAVTPDTGSLPNSFVRCFMRPTLSPCEVSVEEWVFS